MFLSRDISTLPPISTINIQNKSKLNRLKPNAFIITGSCNSFRYNTTKANIERAFPNFFNLICFPSIPLNDSRVHPYNIPLLKKLTSNLLAFVEIWTHEIPKYSTDNKLEWTFIFEDDVNFIDSPKPNVSNLSGPLEEMMNNSEIRGKDGFLYLGICSPTYSNDSELLLWKNRNYTIAGRKGHGYCLHASAITAKRSKLFCSEISSYRPNLGDLSLDHQLRQYSIRSKRSFYTLGTNYEFPPGTGHFGIAYQDRGRFSSTVSDVLP